ncbi:MAG: hypothetical protein IH948_07305 [Bacteroidetes bacterium]|nr:hypothetical protein [Bacteroidota bacterium]
MKKLILLFLLLPVFASAQIVNIPDANFKTALLADMNINTNGDGEIDSTEAAAADTMKIAFNKISDLTGIGAFTELVFLDCYWNTITSFDFSNNPNLTYIKCDYNLATTLDVTKCTGLTYLNAFVNELTSVDISKNPLINFLDFGNNYFTSIDVTNNLLLEIFYCQGNALTSIDITKNTELTFIYCGYDNTISSLDVSNNTKLEWLNCPWIGLNSLDVSNNPALISLSCHTNNITSLDLSNNPNIEFLYSSHNEITSLDVAHLSNLNKLYAHYNNLNYLNVKTGNNVNMSYFNAVSNPNLACITVDDTAWAYANWAAFYKDPGAVFSLDCAVGIEDNPKDQPSISSYNNAIILKGRGTATIFNLQGQRVHHSRLTGKTSISLDRGIYLVRVTLTAGKAGSEDYRGAIPSFTKKVYLH